MRTAGLRSSLLFNIYRSILYRDGRSVSRLGRSKIIENLI